MKLLYLPSLAGVIASRLLFFSSEQKPKSPFFHFVKPLLSRCCAGTKVVHLDTEVHNRTRYICKGREQESSRARSLNMKCMCYRGSWKCRPWSLLGKTPGNLIFLRSEELQWWNHELFQISQDLAPTFLVSICSFLEEQQLSPLLSLLMSYGYPWHPVCKGWQEQDSDRYLSTLIESAEHSCSHWMGFRERWDKICPLNVLCCCFPFSLPSQVVRCVLGLQPVREPCTTTASALCSLYSTAHLNLLFYLMDYVIACFGGIK